MEIRPYREAYQQAVIRLILHIQNDEANLHLSLEEQPDLMDIVSSYRAGGKFWVAVQEGRVVGTIGLIRRESGYGILKKFFVDAGYRSRKVGLRLYETLLAYAGAHGVRHLLLDTPSVAAASHRFYERAGFVRIAKKSLAVEYVYPDRDSYLYQKKL